MTYNKLTVEIGEERRITLEPISYQYDVQQFLVITGEDLPEFYTAEFCNEGDENVIPVPGTAAGGVPIPNSLLKTGKNVLAYLVITGEGTAVETRYTITIPVNARPLRSDIDLDDDQQLQVDALIAALNEGVGRAEDAAEAIQNMGVEAETLAAGSAASVEKTVDPETGEVTLSFGIPRGDQGNPGNDGVTPDFRIGTVETLPPTSPATATITGTAAEPVLNLGIPQGQKGDPGGSGGTSDYTELENKPQINGHTLNGDQSASDLGLGTYSKPGTGIPKTDLASDVQQSLGKADSALQSAPVSSVAGKTGAVTLDAEDVEFDETETYAAGSIGAEVSQQKNAISQLEDQVVTDVTVTGTVVTIVAQANKRYLCGTVSTIDVTPCATGAFDLIFTSGTTAAVLTIPNTVKWQDSSFDPTALDTDTIYEISVADGTLGLVAKWT